MAPRRKGKRAPSPERAAFRDDPEQEQQPQAPHVPVLLTEVLEGLQVHAGGAYIDGTVGAGGHSLAILQSAENVRLLGVDTDPNALALAAERLRPFVENGQAKLVRANFEDLGKVARNEGFPHVDGILLDLGVSSMQLDTPERGFSFRAEGPLDMRLNPEGAVTAADLVNSLPEEELANLIYRYGEEPASRRIARRIVEARARESVTTTGQLAEIVSSALGGRVAGRTRNPIHPATRTFQALRIAVNRELDVLESALGQAVDLLRPGGRLAVISFHSLEDRAVKQFIRQEQKGCICPPELPICQCGRKPTLRAINSKPVEATEQEKRTNPRSRSARLRVAVKLGDNGDNQDGR